MVELYRKYKGRVHFVVVDMDVPRPAAQQALVKKLYRGDTPDLVVLNKSGKVVLNVLAPRDKPPTPTSTITKALDTALK